MYDSGQFNKLKRWGLRGPILIGLVSVGLVGFLLYILSRQERNQEVKQQTEIIADSTRQADSLLQTEPDDTVLIR
ncbi:hypothetical protein GCM10028805_49170 [Spirosoma harenae]